MVNNKKIYNITFVGQDYQPLDDAAKNSMIILDGKEYYINNHGGITPKTAPSDLSNLTYCRKILDQMLNEVAPAPLYRCKNMSLVVNAAGNDKKQLYDPNFGNDGCRGYFCGIVGVIKKQIALILNEDRNEAEESKKEIFNVTLQIKSRLDAGEDGEIVKPYFLSTMLLRDKIDLSNNTIPCNEDEIFDYLLLFWFKEQLQTACLKGYYKTYRSFEKNDDKIKGSINVTRHIKLNMGQTNGQIAYSYRENTINNFLNHLIVAAYHHLKSKYHELVSDYFDSNIELKKTIDYLSNATGFSSENKNYLVNRNRRPISHPYYIEYEGLRVTCLKILRDEGISIFDGELDQDIQGILFYLPELWEKFIYEEVIQKAIPADIECKPQFEVKNFGYLTSDTKDTYEFKQTTYPDFVFFHDAKPLMILDAKFKPAWEMVFDRSSISSVLKDYDKCIRDMVAVNSHATGVIFPTNRTSDPETVIQNLQHPISKYNSTDCFYTIPLQIPKVKKRGKEYESYAEWTDDFKEKMAESIKYIYDSVQRTKKSSIL